MRIGFFGLDEIAKLKALISQNELLLHQAKEAIAALDRLTAKDERLCASAFSEKLLQLSNQTLEAATDILRKPHTRESKSSD